MRCFVTGASGFIGNNLVRELLRDGHEVRALVRAGQRPASLSDLDFEPELVSGDLRDRASLDRALAGCDWCFHAGASYYLWMKDYTPMYASNVDGTRNVLEAAGRAGCTRIVYTSTVGCIGLPKPVNGRIQSSDETAVAQESQLSNPYKHSKWQAECLAQEKASAGLPVVIVNPSAPVGPYDVKPTPTGQMIVDFLAGNMPAYMDTGLNWVHVRDVARGHILAAEKGRIGERYILGNADGNWTMRETLEELSAITGLRAPKLRIPYAIALGAAYLNETVARITKIPPKAAVGAVRMARYKMFFNPAKAVNELGLPQTPPQEGFREAINWFQERGYIDRLKKTR